MKALVITTSPGRACSVARTWSATAGQSMHTPLRVLTLSDAAGFAAGREGVRIDAGSDATCVQQHC